MKLGRDAILGVGLIVVLVGVIVMSGRPADTSSSELVPRRTSYNAAAGGTRALFESLQRMGHDVRRWQKPVDSLESGRALLLVAPQGTLSDAEWRSLLEWTQHGRLLVLAPEGNDTLVRPDPVAARVLPAGPLASLGTLPAYGDWRADYSTDGLGLPPELLQHGVPLVRDPKGTVVRSVPWGRGTVLIFQSPWTLSNSGLRNGDTAAFVEAMLGLVAAAGPVWFDEYHHGYSDNGGLWSLMPWSVRGGLLSWGLAALLLAWSFSALRPARPLTEGVRVRGEYLASMAALYREARATRLVLDEELAALEAGGAPPEVLAKARAMAENARPGQVLATVQSLRRMGRQ